MRRTFEVRVYFLMLHGLIVWGLCGTAIARTTDLDLGYEGGKIVLEEGECRNTLGMVEFPASGAIRRQFGSPVLADSDPSRFVFNDVWSEANFEEAIEAHTAPVPSTSGPAAFAVVAFFASRRGWRSLWDILRRPGLSRGETMKVDDPNESEEDASHEEPEGTGLSNAADAAQAALREHISQRNQQQRTCQ